MKKCIRKKWHMSMTLSSMKKTGPLSKHAENTLDCFHVLIVFFLRCLYLK